MNCKTLTLAAAITLASALSLGALTLEEGFKAPPASAKPHTWYHMMNGNVTKEGITCDFEALAKAGIGGVQMFDAGCAIPPGPLKFNSDDWFDMFASVSALKSAFPTAPAGLAPVARGTRPRTA